MTPREINIINGEFRQSVVDVHGSGLKELMISEHIGTRSYSFRSMKIRNNDDSNSNGEQLVYSYISQNVSRVFDVGARRDTNYINASSTEYHLFEPNPKFHAILESSIARLQPGLNIKCNQIGIGNKDDNILYYPATESFEPGLLSDPAKESIEIQTQTLDTYCSINNIRGIDFLKVDTEGYETEVFEGGANILSNTKYIQFEYGGTWQYGARTKTLKNVFSMLGRSGFNHFFTLVPNGLWAEHYEQDDDYVYRNIFACKTLDEFITQIVNVPTTFNYKFIQPTK